MISSKGVLGSNYWNPPPSLALREFTYGKAPDNNFFAREVVSSPSQIHSSGRGSRASDRNDIEADAALEGQILRQTATGSQHIFSDGIDQVVAVSE